MQQEILIGRDVLETLTSSLYEDPIIIFREYVQNSLDAFNIATEDTSLKFDGFCVNIDIDQKNKDIVIKDNGYGIKDNFSIIMLRLGDSDKLGSKGNIGFRGIGRLSGLLFCSRLTFENKVAEYIKQNENNHVLYRVTPIFEGENLLATGVEMEAYSIEDNGQGVCFNVFVYNVEPGITINYKTGESSQNN